jgi:hypothetical protein
VSRGCVWVEYAKTTDANSVSNRFENTNADAGTAVHNQGGGRAQISEFYLYGNTDSDGNHGWKLGLTDVTTQVDTSALANDEVSQFLSLELVNNMTISFPDHALAAMVQELSWNGLEDFGYRLVVSSSHGVQDSAEPNDEIQSYPELFDVTAHDKGVFGAGELLNNVFITPMVQWASGMKLGDLDANGDEIYDLVETNYWLFGLRLEFWM